jgi:RNA polymerase sigma-70 factor (ECF subfamily)
MEQKDEELIEAFNKGSGTAFEALFERYKLKVFNFALRMLCDRPEAEDVTSETFMQLYQRKFVYNRTAKISTWLFAVARNGCITRIRKRQGLVSVWFRKDSKGEQEMWDFPDDKASASDELNKNEEKMLVRKAINRLPLMQKDAIILREYICLSYEDIAEVLGCSVSNVKILIFRAREQLRAELSSLIMGEKS